MRRASAGKITAVIPYYGLLPLPIYLCLFYVMLSHFISSCTLFLVLFGGCGVEIDMDVTMDMDIDVSGYARQDRKLKSRVPISAADMARLLEAMGVDR